jgi:hypothetical protein
MPALTNTPMLLLVNAHDAQVMQDALTAFAMECDRTGDPCNEATHADELWQRLDALKQLGQEDAREIVKAMGLGRYRGRPQG